MRDFKERLVQFARERYNLGQSLFEDHCGINRGTINSIKVKGPSADIIMKISRACPELNLNWLFRGEEGGAMLNASDPAKVENSSPLQVSPVNVNNVQAVFITNWKDVQGIVEEAVRNVNKK